MLDFNDSFNDDDLSWNIVNDGVMGGLSKGYIDYNDKSMIFEGNLSLENNGGFSWAKSPTAQMDLSDFNQIEIKYRSKERSVDFTFETEGAYRVVYFKEELKSTKNKWKTVTLDLDNFAQYYFGRFTGKMFKKRDDVLRMGLIMNDKKEGAFKIEVDDIKFK